MTLTDFLDQKIKECREETARIDACYKRGVMTYDENKKERLQAAAAAWKEIESFCFNEKIDREYAKDIVFQPLYASVGVHVQKVPVRYYPRVEQMTGSIYWIYDPGNAESLFNDDDPIGKTFNFKATYRMGDEKIPVDYLFKIKSENFDHEKNRSGWKCYEGIGKLEGYYWCDASIDVREHEGKIQSVALQKTYLDDEDPIWKKRAAHPVEGYWWVGFNEEVPDELEIPEGEFYYDETKDEQGEITMNNSSNPGRPEGPDGVKTLERMNREHAPLRDFGFSNIEFRPGMRILDVGCGGGMTIAEMLKLSEGSVIDGIDYSPTSVEQSKEQNKEYLGSRVNIYESDVTKLPFENDTFDLATAVETVYFWPDLQAGLKEIRRVLKPGGQIAIFNEGSDQSILEVWPKIDGMRIYTPAEITKELEDAGFENVHVEHGDEQIIAAIGCKN